MLSPSRLCAMFPGLLPESLAMAVLYYVAPEFGFTLDLLSWAPCKMSLVIRHCLQLHAALLLRQCCLPAEPAAQQPASLALTVLYYVAPESGSTLYLLLWAQASQLWL